MREAEADLRRPGASVELERTRDHEAELQVVRRPHPIGIHGHPRASHRRRLGWRRSPPGTEIIPDGARRPGTGGPACGRAGAHTADDRRASTVDVNRALEGIENEIKTARVNVNEAQARIDTLAGSVM